MENRIVPKIEGADALAKTMKCSRRMVYKALNYSSDSELAQRIRKAALERGMRSVSVLDQVETFHDADGKIRQILPNGAVIELDKNTGEGNVWFKEKRELHYGNVMLQDIANIQAAAARLR